MSEFGKVEGVNFPVILESDLFDIDALPYDFPCITVSVVSRYTKTSMSESKEQNQKVEAAIRKMLGYDKPKTT